MITHFLFYLLFCFPLITLAQEDKELPVYVGYYAPYIIQYGARAGTQLDYKSWETETRNHSLLIEPRLGAYFDPNVQQNYTTEGILNYTWYKEERKTIPKVGLGLGYQLARQNVDGEVNIGNGDISFNKRTLNSFVPTINVGVQRRTDRTVQYSINGFFGRKFVDDEVNSTIFGLEIGTFLHFSKKN